MRTSRGPTEEQVPNPTQALLSTLNSVVGARTSPSAALGYIQVKENQASTLDARGSRELVSFHLSNLSNLWMPRLARYDSDHFSFTIFRASM